jgi:CubicO group peptidase (beta-lactamase class C family)
MSTKIVDGNFLTQPGPLRAPPVTARRPRTAPIKPEWATYVADHIGDVAGYAFVVAHNDKIVAEGASGFARTSADPPEEPWTVRTRINLASVSKCVTAVAMLKLMDQHRLRVDEPFYPQIEARCPSVATGVASVTFQNLLEMKSGLVGDGTLETPDIWAFLSGYLQQPLAGTPGVTSLYSNTNFTILQAIISLLVDPENKGGDGVQPYVRYVTDHVLIPMGIEPSIFNPIPDPRASATLSYAYSDIGSGQYWTTFNCVGAGGWIASPRELIKLLIGIRKDRVLNKSWTQKMLSEQLGWYEYDGVDGKYYDHNGWLLNGAAPNRGLNTGIIRLAEGYDALLVVNTQFVDTIGLLIGAFEA